ncbi:hypothetical protein PLEOSDRAFT_169883 [Pleurotus ostreatus PC15]|uniref:CxC2-like cysteine cluster KDZ transposase-associated domain-containing protein n=1 Tax=Pleurotus ostreatus (strain PC15) TaxID=1137138 RepID=A0A067NR14_PLEO1|nr:hypothetical protein PLEOSDRAFT_169883 [Pleurotus ostreatus PC15]
MGKEKKKRRLYVLEPEVRTFVATRATKSRIHQTLTEAPVATKDPPPLLSNTLEFALSSSGGDQQDPYMVDATTPDAPTDGSGLVIRTRAKRYLNSLAGPPTQFTVALIATGIGCIVVIVLSSYTKRWTDDNYFGKCTLRDLGLRIQLGHPRTVACPMVKRGHVDFVVIHTNGIHLVNVDFCGCPNSIDHFEQLLDVGWWPSSPLEPQTATTFGLLRLFHLLNLQGCIPSTDFYRALEQLNHGEGLVPLPDRLQQFMLTVREWRHIRMAKRAGRGNDPAGLDATANGALAVPCRSCPHPNINLPDGWEREPPETRWLYGLLLQEDANFKQKNRLRSTDNRDPALGPDWATFVAEGEYFSHLANYIDQEEINHCVGFAALWSANTRRSKGLRATGVGSWFRNFFSRMEQLPKRLQLSTNVDLHFRIAKFHLEAHKESCHAPFSLNYTKWVGRTDGEGVECMWSWLNKIAHSASMMGPGGRQDTLDDFCNFWNWRKTVNLKNLLLEKMMLVIPQALVHHQAFCAFTSGLREHHAVELCEWEKQVQAWETDQTNPCPFDLLRDDIRMSDVKKAMAEEEHRTVERGLGDTSPSAFLITGLEIEEAQQEVLVAAMKKDLTTVEATQLQTNRTSLLKRITKFRNRQSMYMPGVSNYLRQAPNEENTTTPETMPLFLPSFFPKAIRSEICPPDICNLEDRLRFVQASEALAKLRRQLQTRSFAHSYKTRNVNSQGAYTHSCLLQNQIEVCIKAIHVVYNIAREALISLRGTGDWQNSLRPLLPEDIRGINERTLNAEEQEEYRHTRALAGMSAEAIQGESNGAGLTSGQENIPTVAFSRSLTLGEGRRTLSWMWYTVSDNEILGVGEVQAFLMLEEEMSRAIAYCRWKAEYWDNTATARTLESFELREGVHAYARRQADFEWRHALQWEGKWQTIRDRASFVLTSQLSQMGGADIVPAPALVVELDLDYDNGGGEDSNNVAV